MTLHHDAYFFDPENFTSAMQPHRTLLDDLHSIEAKMKSGVVSLLVDDERVQNLADNYGSWTTQDIDEVDILDHQEISFLLTFTLYKILKTEDHVPGLRSYWQDFLQSLLTIGWDQTEAETLVKGRNFRSFPKCYWHIKDAPAYWELNTFSTGGNIGWLNLTDVRFFHDKLMHDADRLKPSDSKVAQQSFELAQIMLQKALQHNSGLCLIISG